MITIDQVTLFFGTEEQVHRLPSEVSHAFNIGKCQGLSYSRDFGVTLIEPEQVHDHVRRSRIGLGGT